jgi:hypothetical protein
MKAISYILFSLSLLVIMGHDFVPHVHEGESALSEDIVTLPLLSASNSKSELSHLLGRLKHNSAATSFTYLITLEKRINVNQDVLFFLPAIPLVEHGAVWYSNFRKQRFWGSADFSCKFILHSFPHRGPPADYAQA